MCNTRSSKKQNVLSRPMKITAQECLVQKREENAQPIRFLRISKLMNLEDRTEEKYFLHYVDMWKFRTFKVDTRGVDWHQTGTYKIHGDFLQFGNKK